MKPGTKLLRTFRNSQSCKVFVGKVYTFAGEKDGFIKLKERARCGFSWELKHFNVQP